ncbi:MAG: DUF1573 domain-containing protein [bacterium]
MAKDNLCLYFQNSVSDSLIRHKSVLDVLSKFQETNARVNRAVVKAVTQCGCLKIKAEKPAIPEDISFRELKQYMETHLEGHLCSDCREAIEKEVGKNLFYLAGLCEYLDLSMEEIMDKEYKKVSTLGIFNLT